jgi:hypothetical protein
VLPEWERNRITGFSYVYTKAKQHLASISTIVRCWWTCKRPAVSPAPELCPFYIFFLKKTICQLLETIYDIGRSTSYCRYKKRHTGTAQKRNYRRKKIIPQSCNNVKCVQLRTLRINSLASFYRQRRSALLFSLFSPLFLEIKNNRKQIPLIRRGRLVHLSIYRLTWHISRSFTPHNSSSLEMKFFSIY